MIGPTFQLIEIAKYAKSKYGKKLVVRQKS
jgi:hypothetical protein